MRIVDVAWWVTVVGAVAAPGLVLIWPLLTGPMRAPMSPAAVRISPAAIPGLLPPGSADSVGASRAMLRDITAQLTYGPSEWRAILLGAFVMAASLAALLIGLHLLRSFLQDVRAASVFTAQNARRLHLLGWVLVVAGLLLPVLQYAYSLYMVRQADLAGIPVTVRFTVPNTSMVGLLVLILATAWRYGVELQHANALTAEASRSPVRRS